MSSARLTPLDAAFLAVETPTAHMHVGWVATFTPPAGADPPGFDEIVEHIERRLPRAPRFRQKLLPVPLGLHYPVWVDDAAFDVRRHVVHSDAKDLAQAVDECMSEALPRERPLWQICIADRLADGQIAVVGKAHHCMVDGVAAVELASLLVDRGPDPQPTEPDDWRPEPPPDTAQLVGRALLDRARDELGVAALPARIARSPARVLGGVGRVARALGDAVRPADPSPLNEPISSSRHLAIVSRPVDDLLRIKRCFGVTLNDVVLAVAAGGVRAFLRERGDRPVRLKTMVPVSVRGEEESEELGNRLSFMFVDLPCDEPDPGRRLMEIHLATAARKEAGEPQGANAVLDSIKYTPHLLQSAISRVVTSPRAFNLVVSNIPGPREPLYLLGCELREAYPVVPLADRHDLAIGVTTIRDRACFGLFADPESLPDADLLARDLDQSIDELLARSVREELAEALRGAP